MLAELGPKPDQATVTVNTAQMNVTDHAGDTDFADTSRATDAWFKNDKHMLAPPAPLWVEEPVPRLSAAGIQRAFPCDHTHSSASVEQLALRGFYTVPLVMNRMAIAPQAREIRRIGVFYDSTATTLAANGFAPNRNGGTQGYLHKTP